MTLDDQMTRDDQLLYEARVRPRQAVVAGLAGALLIIAAIVQLSGPHAKVDELTVDLITVHKRYPRDVIGALINAGGYVALAATLSFLLSAARARNPKLKPFIKWLAIGGGVVAGLSSVVYAAVIASKASQFVAHGSQTYDEANHLTSSTIVLALPFVGQAAALVLAIAFVLVALNAMRVGLLTRFMGYLGIFGGVLILFVITPVPIVQAYWLFGLALLLAGRWPTGVPPAWRTGRAEKWPSSSELRAQRAPAGGGGRGKPAATPAPEKVAAPAARGTRAATSKRKRKRRR